MTWSRLLALCTATRRPLIFINFKTAGLNGAPPVEYAIAYYTPWAPPEQDKTSAEARKSCPPGLTYAATGRLNPGVPIDPEAQAVHGITDAEVAKCLRYDDLAGVGPALLALAAGDAGAEEGPAVWCGHNLVEADVPWAQRWGYLPRMVGGAGYGSPPMSTDENQDYDVGKPLAVVDTCRLSRRLTASHQHPLAPDAVTWQRCPAVGHGLAPYNGKMLGLHTALFGDPPESSHAALADVCTTARCLAAVLDLWSPLWPTVVQGEDPHAALEALLTALNAPPPGVLSWDGWLKEHPTSGLLWARGKHKGQRATADRDYARWVSALPSSPTGDDGQAWCSDATRAALAASK